jgi:GAF domain-containing protein
MRLCEAKLGFLSTFDGQHFDAVAMYGVPEAYAAEYFAKPYTPAPGTTHARVVNGEDVVHVTDLIAEGLDSPRRRAVIEMLDARTILGVALRKDGALLGVLHVYRQEVRPFSEKQIALLQNFAAQAVIAMENARLITETKEALDQQTATAEVLQVINSSPGDLAPVFDAMLEKAMRLCEATFGTLWTWDGEHMNAAAVRGASAEYTAFLQKGPHPPSPIGHQPLLHGAAVVHIDDLTTTDGYQSGSSLAHAVVELGGVRTLVAVPLRKDAALLGVFSIYRDDVRPFSDKQITLLQNFAAQAVIAIENARLITETREALDQQTATAEVLGVINSSPGDLAPVFDAMLEKAMRLCEAAFGFLSTYQGDDLHQAVAMRNVPEAVAHLMREPMLLGPETGMGRLVVGDDFVHIADAADDDAYRLGNPTRRAFVDLAGAHTYLAVPLRKDGVMLGGFWVYRQEVRPFTDKQIALLQNFAAQAVIAMENARLITETREALEQQTATAEVLGVINSSAFDLKFVFNTLVETAARLCAADMAMIFRPEGNVSRLEASYGFPPAYAAFLRETYIPQRAARQPRASITGRTFEDGRIVHIHDVAEDPEFDIPEAITLGKMRTALGVPLMRDGAPIGVIALSRERVEPFTERQIELVRTFADQAVIAIENARLITETREALDQQTATAEVLGVINSSPGDLTPVFDAILDKAHSICGVMQGSLQLFDGEKFRAVAVRGLPEPFADRLREGTWDAEAPVTKPLFTGARFVHVPDLAEVDHPLAQVAVSFGDTRTFLCVPLRKGLELFGMIVAARREVRPFSDKEIALLENFAAQAVIAMENARLITETREALDQQTATAEVLGVINSSPGDLAPVFDAMLERAFQLCEAQTGHLMRYENGEFNRAASFGGLEDFDKIMPRHQPLVGIVTRDSVPFRTLVTHASVHVLDMAEDASYRAGAPAEVAGVQAGIRTALFVPLLREGEVIGNFVMHRQEKRPFTDKQIALVENFAAQAVIAIENARLITETREARDAAEAALGHLKAAQANLIQAEKMASLGQLTAGIAHEIKNPLNFVNNFASLSVELLDELREATDPVVAALSADKRAEVDETIEMLSGNLEKIAEHGKRADNIVKSMLEHSRGVTGERREVDLNGLIDEALNLAYHAPGPRIRALTSPSNAPSTRP